MPSASPRGAAPPSPPRRGASSASSTGSGLLELLTLERIEDDFFRTAVLSSDPLGRHASPLLPRVLPQPGRRIAPGAAHRAPGPRRGLLLQRRETPLQQPTPFC